MPAQTISQSGVQERQPVVDKSLIKTSIFIQAKFILITTNQAGSAVKHILSAPSVIALPNQQATVFMGQTVETIPENNPNNGSATEPVNLGLELHVLPSVEPKGIRIRGHSAMRQAYDPASKSQEESDPLKYTLLNSNKEHLITPDPKDGSWTLAVQSTETHFNILTRRDQPTKVIHPFPQKSQALLEIEISAKMMP
jgi:hypothetical protein